jgi:hypothetical protein
MLASGLESIRDAYRDVDCEYIHIQTIDMGEREYEGIRGYLWHTLEHILEKRSADLTALREGDGWWKVIVKEVIVEGDTCERLK